MEDEDEDAEEEEEESFLGVINQFLFLKNFNSIKKCLILWIPYIMLRIIRRRSVLKRRENKIKIETGRIFKPNQSEEE